MSEDKEIERIRMKKMQDTLQRNAQSQPQSTEKPIGKPIALTDASFSSTISEHKLMVVDFWAPWCGPCRMVGPIIEELATEYAGKVTFGKLNVDDNPMISSRFGVQGIPTLLFFKDGKAVDSLVGAAPKSYIESKFKPYLERNA